MEMERRCLGRGGKGEGKEIRKGDGEKEGRWEEGYQYQYIA